jgi:hypothetical protein
VEDVVDAQRRVEETMRRLLAAPMPVQAVVENGNGQQIETPGGSPEAGQADGGGAEQLR